MTAALALAAMVVALRFIPAGRPHCAAPQLPARRVLPPPVAQLSTVSPQTEEEVAVQRAGHPHTPESRAKISAANKGKMPWNKGREHTEETRRRISEGTRRALVVRQQEQEAAERAELEELRLRDPQEHARRIAVAEAEEAEKRERRERRAQREMRRAAALASPPRPRAAVARAGSPRAQGGATRPRGAPRAPGESFFTDEARARISASLKQRWLDPEYRARRANKTVSAETRAKLSRVMKEKWAAANGTFRSRTGNGSHSIERRQKISASIRAKWADPDYRNRTIAGIRASHKNGAAAGRKPQTDEERAAWRAKISAAMKLRWRNETFRAQQLESGESYRGSAAATEAMKRRSTEAMRRRPPPLRAEPAAETAAPAAADAGGGSDADDGGGDAAADPDLEVGRATRELRSIRGASKAAAQAAAAAAETAASMHEVVDWGSAVIDFGEVGEEVAAANGATGGGSNGASEPRDPLPTGTPVHEAREGKLARGREMAAAAAAVGAAYAAAGEPDMIDVLLGQVLDGAGDDILKPANGAANGANGATNGAAANGAEKAR